MRGLLLVSTVALIFTNAVVLRETTVESKDADAKQYKVTVIGDSVSLGCVCFPHDNMKEEGVFSWPNELAEIKNRDGEQKYIVENESFSGITIVQSSGNAYMKKPAW